MNTTRGSLEREAALVAEAAQMPLEKVTESARAQSYSVSEQVV